MNKLTLLTVILMLASATMTRAQNYSCRGDSALTHHHFQPKQLAAPLTLMAAGGAGIAIHDKLGSWNKNGHTTKADEYLQYVPLASNLILDFVGVKGRHNFGDRALISATAFAVDVALTKGLKFAVSEERPDGSASAFPSGHTAMAFTGAELVRQEYGWGPGAAAYAVALCTGALRIYNNRHWCNDILAGAGIGILSANVANWLYPAEKKLIDRIRHGGRKTHQTSVALCPLYEPRHNATGLALNIIY